MVQVLIGGIPVEFPFEPYSVQKVYMEKVLDSLKQERHAVLESPTGTGKTLSLLCSSLAWLQSVNMKLSGDNGLPGGCFDPNNVEHFDEEGATSSSWGGTPRKRIIYSSRTHSQLSKAMNELQTTAYKNVKVTMLGSRDQLCIHPIVSKESTLSAKNALCSMHIKAKSCSYNNHVENAKKDPVIMNGIVDIEDLISFSKKKCCCPYYLARDLQENADIIFMPYNYLFDANIRKKLNILLYNTVVILDEGHNVDKVCEEATSISLTSTDIAVASEEVTAEMNVMYDTSTEDIPIERKYSKDDLCNLKQLLLNLEEEFDGVNLSSEGSKTFPGSFIYNLFAKAQINYESSIYFIGLMKSLQEVLQYKATGTSRGGYAVGKIADSLDVLYSIKGNNIDLYFKTHIEQEKQPERDHRPSWGTVPIIKPNAKKVNFWCFHPGFGMKSLLDNGVHSLILTSGTLAPLPATVQELGLQNPITLESPHIVDHNQVSVCVLTKGPNNVELRSGFANRDNKDYWAAIGLTLQNFLRIVPDGILIFFPSYSALNKAVGSWKGSGLWAKLTLIKPFFVEESNKNTFNVLMEEFRESVRSGRGAVLIGVCRGKVAEGMDFIDSYGRAVLVFGLPYPPIYDPKVKLKKDYLNSNKGINLTGEMWYQLEATRAVNQAIGRVIRHINDFGVIVLCDIKFTNRNVINDLSKWIQPVIRQTNNFGETIQILRQFFKRNSETMTTIQAQMQRSILPSSSSSNMVPKVYYSGPSTSGSHQQHQDGHSSSSPFIQGEQLVSQLDPCKKRTATPTLSCLAAMKQAEEDAEKAQPLTTPRSLYLMGEFDREIKVPAKRRKIAVAPLIVTDLKSNDTQHQDKVQKLNFAKNFILEMKNTLEEESYAQFDMVLRKFHKDHDLDEFIEKLSTLFPAEDVYFREVFRDCSKMLSGKNLEKFQKYCEDKYPV